MAKEIEVKIKFTIEIDGVELTDDEIKEHLAQNIFEHVWGVIEISEDSAIYIDGMETAD